MSELSSQTQAVIEVLNKARSMELYSILQYMDQHYVLDNLDYGTFADDIKRIAIDEMRHAEKFAERVKELGGQPTQEVDGSVMRNQDIRKIFAFNAGVEQDVLDTYNRFAMICLENKDALSAHLFRIILMEEQEHFNWFADQKNHVETLGDFYLSRFAGAESEMEDSTMGFTVSEDARRR